MILFKRKKHEEELLAKLPGRAYLGVIGQAVAAGIALFTVLCVTTQFFVPGLLTDSISPKVIVAIAAFGLVAGSLSDRGANRLLVWPVTAVLVGLMAWAVWLYLEILPYGRLAYAVVGGLALIMVAWRRPEPENKKDK